MDLKQFRIGNFAYMGGDVWQEEGQFEIREITGQDLGHPFINEFIKPIELTKEWLIKFGFKKDDILSEYTFCDSFTIKCQGYDISIGLDGNFYNGIFTQKLEFVHQLQNIFFALTGTELVLSAGEKV